MTDYKGTLEGKVVIITGGGTGLGKAMALLLAQEGADIVVAARRVLPIEEVAAEVRKIGRRALAIPTDCTDPTQVNQMVDRALKEMGKIDVLVNNAGLVRGARAKPMWEITDTEWREGIDVNLSSAFYCTRAVSKYFVEHKSGKVINVSSGEGFRGVRDNYMYCCAKGGVVQLTRTLAVSWAPFNIQVNCIVPGFVDTFDYQPPEYQKVLEQYRMSRSTRLFLPVGHTGKPDDIGFITLFLCSDASDYITGSFFAADGGGLAGGFATTGYTPTVSLKEALA